MKRKLTKTVIAELQATDREYTVWDDRIPGFGVRVWPSGVKSYTFLYRTAGGRAGKQKRITIKATTPDMAFDKAKALAAQYYGGVDPSAVKAEEKAQATRANAVPTVSEVLDSFVENHAKATLKPKTYIEYERIVKKLLSPHIGSIKIDALSAKEVGQMYHALRHKPTQAAGAVRVLSSAMSWAEEFGLRTTGSNPAKIRLKGTRRRQRLFSDNEVSRLNAALDGLEKEGRVAPPVTLGIRLLFATGCRAGEITGLRWDNVDFDAGMMRWPDTKTGYLEKPITEEAKDLLEAASRLVGVPWVCPSSAGKQLRVETLEAGFERTMKTADVVAGENATLHLIRHWFATKTYTDVSIPLPLQMAIVGHGSVATAMRYAHIDREQLMSAARGASQRRKDAVKSAEKSGEVVPLRKDQL